MQECSSVQVMDEWEMHALVYTHVYVGVRYMRGYVYACTQVWEYAFLENDILYVYMYNYI